MSVLDVTTSMQQRRGGDDDPLSPRARALLLAFSQRRRAMSLAGAALLACAVGLAVMLASCMIDRILPLPAPFRLLLLLANAAAIGSILSRPLRDFIAPPRSRLARDARQLEQLVPALGERLMTLASLDGHNGHNRIDRHAGNGQTGSGAAASAGASPANISRAMLRQIARDVDRALDGVNVATLLPPAALRPATLPAIAAIVLAGVLAYWPWLDLPELAARYLLPLSEHSPVTTTRLSVEPGDARLIAGRPFQVLVRATHLGDRCVKIHIADVGDPDSDSGSATRAPNPPGGDEQGLAAATSASMTPAVGAAGSFLYSIPSVDRDFVYWVSGGDARSRKYLVRAVRQPGILELRGAIHLPEYLHAPPLPFASSDGTIDAMRGSRIELSIVATDPLRSAHLFVRDQPIETEPTAEPNVRRASFVVDRDAAMRFELLSRDGVVGAGPPGARVRAHADRAPSAAWRLPRPSAELLLRPRDRVSLPFEAGDDVELASLSAAVSVNESPVASIPLPLPAMARWIEGTFQLSLADLNAAIGDAVDVRIEAVDSAGQIVRSVPCRLDVSPVADDLDARYRMAALAAAASDAEQAAAMCQRAREVLSDRDAAVNVHATHDAAGALLSAAAHSAQRAIDSILRAIALADEPATCTALARLADSLQQQAPRLEQIASSPAGSAMMSSPDMEAARAAATDAAAHLKLLWDGERAAQALAELDDATAWETMATPVRPAATQPANRDSAPPAAQTEAPLEEKSPVQSAPGDTQPATQRAMGAAMQPATQSVASQAASRRTITMLRRDARKAAGEVGIELPASGPSASTALIQALRKRVAEARAFAAAQAEVDFARASHGWVEHADARIAWPARLLTASRAAALSRDGDAVWARDLHLASRAAARIDDTFDALRPDVRGAFALALAALCDEHELNRPSTRSPAIDSRAELATTRTRAAAIEARWQMRAWAGEQEPSAAAISPPDSTPPDSSPPDSSPPGSPPQGSSPPRSSPATARATPSAVMTSSELAALEANALAAIGEDASGDRAAAIGRLERRQHELRARTNRRALDEAPALAAAQAALAEEVLREARQASASHTDDDLTRLREVRRRLNEIDRAVRAAPPPSTTPTVEPAAPPSATPATAAAAATPGAATTPGPATPDTPTPDAATPGASTPGATTRVATTARATSATTVASIDDAVADATALAEELREGIPEVQPAQRIIERQLLPALIGAREQNTDAAGEPDGGKAAAGGTTSAQSGDNESRGGGPGGGESRGGESRGDDSATGEPGGAGDAVNGGATTTTSGAGDALNGGAAATSSSANREARVRQAIVHARRALTQAEQALQSHDPLAAAALAARDAQEAMRKPDATARAARNAQDKALQLLAEARRRALSQSARARLADVPAFAEFLADTGVGDIGSGAGGGETGRSSIAIGNRQPRDAGAFRQRDEDDSNTPATQFDPPEYAGELRAYFKALGRR